MSDWRAILLRSRVLSCFASWSWTRVTRDFAVVISTALAPSSCSACEIRSAATQAGVAVRSATTTTSVAPASLSMSTSPKTRRFAACT